MTLLPHAPRHALDPVCTRADGAILAYETLTFQAHLEPLGPNDGALLEKAMDVVEQWVGGRLRWSRGSMFDGPQPFSPDDLGFVAGFADLLSVELDGSETDQERIEIITMASDRVADQGMSCGGSAIAEDRDAQLLGFRFYADVVRLMPDAQWIEAHSVVRVTVPASDPLPDFAAWCAHLAAALPVRWASAGLYLSGAETGSRWEPWKVVAKAYGRRHWGVDVGEYVALLDHFYDWIRSVNWLTWLGPTMVRDLARAGVQPRSNALVDVTGVPLGNGDGLLLRAGDRPERGDLNRLDVPVAYRAADEMVRPRRSIGDGISFFGAWSERETEDWLRRFERRTDAT